MAQSGKVLIIAIDGAVRDSLSLLLNHVGFAVTALASCDEFPGTSDLSGRCCLVLDVEFDDDRSFRFLDRLRAEQPHIPVVALASRLADRRLADRQPFAAVLEKPALGGEVVKAVRAAMARFGH